MAGKVWSRGGAQSAAPRAKQYTYQLDETINVTLDADGNGQGQLAPNTAREKWTVNFVSVSTTQTIDNSPNNPSMITYRSSPVPGNQLAGTFTALLDTDSQSTYSLNINEGLVFVWSGGDPGAVGTVHIEGTRNVWENS